MVKSGNVTENLVFDFKPSEGIFGVIEGVESVSV